MQYHFTNNTTEITAFWGDVHYYTIRADKVLKTHEDMLEVVRRFEEDKTQFDVIDYNTGRNLTKAVREYSVLVEQRKDFTVYEFEFDGREYKTKTTKWSVGKKIKQNAKIIREYQQETICLVDDATNEIIAEKEVIRYLPTFLDEDSEVLDYINELNAKLRAHQVK